jgi:TolB-like protein
VKVPGLHVAARTSAFSFKGKNDDVRTIAEKLNVATLLEGSVRKAGDQVRITTQLINAADGYHLWSETYDRKLTDVFAVQDEIAQAVAQVDERQHGDRGGPPGARGRLDARPVQEQVIDEAGRGREPTDADQQPL